MGERNIVWDRDYAERLARIEKAARRVVEQIPAEHIETARGIRKEIRGSAGSYYITHAQMLDLIDALSDRAPDAGERTP
jgi:hypothetical protein